MAEHLNQELSDSVSNKETNRCTSSDRFIAQETLQIYAIKMDSLNPGMST